MSVVMEQLAGTIDGVNQDFQTVNDYASGSVRVFTPVAELPSFVTELSGRNVRLAQAPLPDDVWFLYYRSL